MKFNVAALLLAAPALISAAPTPVAADVELIAPVTANENVFSRFAMTCNPPTVTGKELEEQKAALADMSAATARAHTAENKCPRSMETEFNNFKTKAARKKTIKSTCVSAYKDCVKERKAANAACKKAGGTVDQGHQDAVTFCDDKRKAWNLKKA
ncbi:hypothetical protein DM02DRAFT_617931 [Periconia macrospinosa]|uniref:Uncharacterized protein n=1 Tax=Periconia macrospinosa TaxID=97972 RepID=A0A2V1DBA4_9PLEO|nr:hypothetical protein DM02DRAFT_617931 [Periconia macrospinosa]